MGFVSNLFGGGGGGGASNPSGNPYTGQLGALAGQQQQVASQIPPIATQLGSLASTQQGVANQILPTAMGQYQAGASGQLTPAMEALSTEALTQANLGTTGTYGNLGLGGSTMEQTDLNANTLQNEAEKANLAAQEESLGLSGLTSGGNFLQQSGTSLGQEVGAYGTEGNILGQAGTSLANAGTQYNTEMQQLMQTLSGLGNKSGGGGLTGALGSGVDSLLNSTGLVSATNQLGLTGGGALTTGSLSDLIAAGGGVDGGAAAGGAIGGADLLGAGAGTAADLLGLLAFA